MLEVEVISPTKMVKRAEVKMVVVPASEGNVGVMRNHIPFSSSIKPGLLKFYDADDYLSKTFFVAKGFVNVIAEKCAILAERIDEDWQSANADSILKQIETLERDLEASKERDQIDQIKEELLILKTHVQLLNL